MKINLPEPQPSKAEWEALYSAMRAFGEAAPWDWLDEEDIFAVRNPETGELGICSVTGALGEHLALITYLGPEGLGGYLAALEGMETASGYFQDQESGLMLLETPQLQASFENREQLDELDRKIIKDLGLRFRGQQAWPLFRHFAPGRVPWFITAPQARFLTVLLEQALIVANDLSEPETFEWADAVFEPEEDMFLVRTQEAEQWVYRIETVAPIYPTCETTVDEEALAILRRQLPLKKLQLQVQLSMLPGGVMEGAPPPYFAYQLIVVDANSGMIIGHDLLLPTPSVPEMLAQTPAKLIGIFENLKFRPEEVQVLSTRLYTLLALPLGHLGIRLSRHDELPMLEEALHAFEEWAQRMM